MPEAAKRNTSLPNVITSYSIHYTKLYDTGKGADFVAGKLKFEDLREIAANLGEPKQISGKQELYEALINMYI